jgi:uncharacterized membrane protein
MLHRHATDALSLVFGIVFAGVTAIWLLNVTAVIDLQQAWLIGPAVLIAAGAVGLVLALRPSRPREQAVTATSEVTDTTEMDWPEEPTSP